MFSVISTNTQVDKSNADTTNSNNVVNTNESITLQESGSAKTTICLNMIVKNESKIITRLLQSVLPIIDCYCICDTGSTDDTVEKIKTFCESKNIPGKIVYEPFKDFAHNRSFALKACQGMSTFVLLLDADMILDIKNFNKESLNDFDSYYILQGNEAFYYQNVRIVRNNGLYSYTGVTHEYINTPPNNRIKLIDKNELFIVDIGDGGSKSDKFERDIRLLLKGLEDEPNCERYMFYLANTYHDSGQYDNAIKYYEKRIKCGGWNQEVWYSYYKIGNAYKNMGRISDAIFTWLKGYDFLPERLEGLYEIINYYRCNSNHKIAYQFYLMGKALLKKNFYRDDFLFLHNDIFVYKLDYEFSIIACYVGINKINDEIVNILNHCSDYNITNNLLFNMKFYKDIIVPLNKITCDEKLDVGINNETIKFNSSSSCLIHKKDSDGNVNGYLMNIRYVNYYITENGRYINCDKNIITANKLVEMDTNFKISNMKCFDIVFDNRQYIGTEDIKIFKNIGSDDILFIGTGLHKSNFLGIVSGKYDITSNNNQLIPTELTQNFNKTECEKNWVYFDFNKSTHIVYKWNPLQICKLNDITNNIEVVKQMEMPRIFNHVRGSSCGFKYYKKLTNNNGNIAISYEESEIWFVVHVVSYENPRHYYHMIVVFDEEMKLLRYSAPFKFEGEPIEYCLSIVVEDERVIMNYSTWDRSTIIGIYDKKYIEGILKYN